MCVFLLMEIVISILDAVILCAGIQFEYELGDWGLGVRLLLTATSVTFVDLMQELYVDYTANIIASRIFENLGYVVSLFVLYLL